MIRSFIKRKIQYKKELKVIRRFHLLSEAERERQKERVWVNPPLISLITPLYNTPKAFLEELLQSVQNQTYIFWELCLADGSDDTHKYVGEICRRYAEQDSRIIYRKLDKNEGIVGNTNQCLTMARGDYIGLVDHDDLLSPSALYEVASAAQNGADFIYTDEMKFQDSIENSVDIVCKNGFGKDELRSHNYICHLTVFKKSLLDDLDELYRIECEGSQDYDMVLRLTEKAGKIVHIPKILYYWRVHQGSVALDLSVKHYAVEAAKRAIAGQLVRSSEQGKVNCNLPYETIYRIKYELKERPLISILVSGDLNKDQAVKYIQELIDRTDYRPLELIIDKKELGVEDDEICISTLSRECGKYEWFNCAAELCHGQYYICLSENCLPRNRKWIEELLMFAQRRDVGVVGAYIKYKDNRIYFAGAVLDKDANSGIYPVNFNRVDSDQGYEANMKYVRNTTILTSICMMISKEIFIELDGFDVLMDSCADADLCLRSRRQGWWNVWTCFADMFYNKKDPITKQWKKNEKFTTRWKDEIEQGDGNYHPLLKRLRKL